MSTDTPLADTAEEITSLRTIAALRGWSHTQQEMLSIILDPQCHDGAMMATTPGAMMGEFDEDWDQTDGDSFISHVETISQVLHHHFLNLDSAASYGFMFECSADGVINGANVTTTIGNYPSAITLVEHLGWDDLSTDPSAVGALGAACIAEALHEAFTGLLTKARHYALLT